MDYASSTGLAEDEFLSDLVTAVTGASPPGRTPSRFVVEGID